MSIDAGAGAGADAGAEGEAVVTVLDRFIAAGVSRESFDIALAAGRIAVAGERITDPATPAPPPTAVAIMLGAGETARGVVQAVLGGEGVGVQRLVPGGGQHGGDAAADQAQARRR